MVAGMAKFPVAGTPALPPDVAAGATDVAGAVVAGAGILTGAVRGAAGRGADKWRSNPGGSGMVVAVTSGSVAVVVRPAGITAPVPPDVARAISTCPEAFAGF